MNIKKDIQQALSEVSKVKENEYEGQLKFESDWPIFNGHFPEQAILPGVYLLESAAATFCQGSQTRLSIKRVHHAKFISPVRPPCSINITTRGEWIEDHWKVKCELKSNKTLVSTVTLEMSPL